MPIYNWNIIRIEPGLIPDQRWARVQVSPAFPGPMASAYSEFAVRVYRAAQTTADEIASQIKELHKAAAVEQEIRAMKGEVHC